MQTIINDIEEYDGRHCSESENGIDNADWDDIQYADLAEQIGIGIVEVHRGTRR